MTRRLQKAACSKFRMNAPISMPDNVAKTWRDNWPGEPDLKAPKVLVVGDLHLRMDHGEHWLRAQPYDQAVFLGDFFDAHDDTVADAQRMAQWLKLHLANPALTFLLGNHDIAYRFPDSQDLRCPGFTPQKAKAINAVLSKKDWEKMRLACMAGAYLLSHAGFSPMWIGEPSVEKILARCKLAENRASKGIVDPVLGYGEAPGGIQRFGGPLWMDFGYFVGIAGINQIVGHTPADDVRIKSTGDDSINLCIDVGNGTVAALVQGKHVAILGV